MIVRLPVGTWILYVWDCNFTLSFWTLVALFPVGHRTALHILGMNATALCPEIPGSAVKRSWSVQKLQDMNQVRTLFRRGRRLRITPKRQDSSANSAGGLEDGAARALGGTLAPG